MEAKCFYPTENLRLLELRAKGYGLFLLFGSLLFTALFSLPMAGKPHLTNTYKV
jgi:hypothetical protein